MGKPLLAADIGEKKIISTFLKRIEAMPLAKVPNGDDVAAFALNQKNLAVLKTDMLVGKTDMPPGMSFRQASRKAMVMTVSDFAAKGVKPLAGVVAFGIPAHLTTHDIDELAKGIGSAAQEYGFYIIGGDTNECEDLTIAVSLFGVSPLNGLVTRAGAKPGDVLVVSGPFGSTSAGFKIVFQNLRASHARESLTRSIYMPKARLELGLHLKRFGASSSIDSSDGLAWSLHELSQASRVGFIVRELPVSSEVKDFASLNRLDIFDLVFYGGEEFEIVATVSRRKWNQNRKSLAESLIPIGEVTRRKELIFQSGRRKRRIERRGYEHFTRGS